MAQKVRMAAYYVRVKKKPDDVVVATAREVLAKLKFPPGADAVPEGHPDYEAVDLYPEATPATAPPSPTANSPRPEGLFDRPQAATRPAATPGPAKPRDPSRPVNVFDLLTAPRTPPDPAATKETAEPPRAPPEPMPAERAAAVSEERGK